jgi:hypothetical protein
MKSAFAVVAGFIVVVALSTGTDAVFEKIGFFPEPGVLLGTGYLVIALIYRTVYTVLGGFVTAWLAPHNPMKHVWVLAVIGQVGGIAGVYAGWGLSAHWYPIALAVLAIPSVWFGGWLKTRIGADEIS